LLANDSAIFTVQSHKIEASGHQSKKQTLPTHNLEKIMKEHFPVIHKSLFPKEFVMSEHDDKEFRIRTYIERHFTDSISKYPTVLEYYSKTKQYIKKIYNDCNETNFNVDEVEAKLCVLYDRMPIIQIVINNLLDYPFTNYVELSLLTNLITWANTERPFEYNIPKKNRSLDRKPEPHIANYYSFYDFVASNEYISKQTYMIPAFVNANENFVRDTLDAPDIALTSLKPRVKKIICDIIKEPLDADQLAFISTNCGYDEVFIPDMVNAIEAQLKKESKI